MNILVNREETIHQHSVGRNETSPSQIFDFNETNFNVAIKMARYKDLDWNYSDINSYIKFEAYTIGWDIGKNVRMVKYRRTDLKMRGCTLQD